MAQQLDWRNDEQADERLNPANMEREAVEGYDRASDGLDDHPISGGVADGKEPSDNFTDKLRNKESNQTMPGGWANNTSALGNSPVPNKAKLFKLATTKGPMGFIALGGGGLMMLAGILGTPSLLLTHITEIFTQRWDFQQVAMRNANLKIINSKLDARTKGYCGKTITVRCKFSSFSQKELDKLEKQGIKAVDGKDSKLTGRFTPTKFEYSDPTTGQTKTLNTQDFMNEVRKPNSSLNRSFLTAYHPKLAGFSDKIYQKVGKTKLKLTKNRLFSDAEKTDEERLKKLKTYSESGETNSGIAKSAAEACGGEGQKKCSEVEEKNKKTGDANTLVDEAEKVKETGTKATGIGSRLTAGLGLFGGADAACSVLQMTDAITAGAKTIRAIQLARFASTFFTAASMIKAGDAVEQDISYLSTILTTTYSKDVNVDGKKSTITTKAATDSIGYRNTAFGDKTPTNSSMMFSVAGGLVSSVQNVRNKAVGLVGGESNYRGTCNVVKNPFVQGVSIVGGIAALFTGAGTATQLATAVGTNVLLTVAGEFLMPMMVDLIAGTVIDKNTVGEFAGDAITSGYQTTASQVANGGGNAPLTPAQAAANSETMKQVAMENADYERSITNPLDPYSPYTMVGSIVGGLLPYTTKINSANTAIGSIASLVTGSVANAIMPTASADIKETAADYTSSDPDYKRGNFASTLNGAVVTGQPKVVLDIDPNAAYARLVSHVKHWCMPTPDGCVWRDDPDPHIDFVTGEPKSIKYKRFIEHCIDREKPWSDPELKDEWSQDGTNDSIGTRDCQVSGSNFSTGLSYQIGPDPAEKDPDGLVGSGPSNEDTILTVQERNDFYAYYNHKRILDGREEGYPNLGAGAASATTGESAGTPSGAPENTVSSGKGWRMKDGFDYSNVPCANGTTENGTYTHPVHKFTYKKCTVDGNDVASLLSERVVKLIAEAKAAGVNLTVSSGVRTYESQQSLYASNCGASGCSPPTAKPGTSSHEFGVAVDWGLNGKTFCFPSGSTCPGNKGYEWMMANAQKYGFYKLNSEAWHFSMDGK